MRASSASGATGAMLAAIERACRRRGRSPRRSGTTRWHVGQLFIGSAARTPRTSLSSVPAGAEVRVTCRAGLAGGGTTPVQPAAQLRAGAPAAACGDVEVDDAVARGALLEHGLAAQTVEELRGQGHVAGLAGAVGRLRDGGPALRSGSSRSAGNSCAGSALAAASRSAFFACGLAVDLAELGADVPLARPELVGELLVLAPRSPRCCCRGGVGVGRELADLLLAVADELAQLLELALRGVGLALGARRDSASRASGRAAGSCCGRPGSSSPRVFSIAASAARSVPSFVVEPGDAGLERVERAALLRQLVGEVFEFCVDLRELFECANLFGDAQCVTPGRGRKGIEVHSARWGKTRSGPPRSALGAAGRRRGWVRGPTWVRTRNGPVMSRGL